MSDANGGGLTLALEVVPYANRWFCAISSDRLARLQSEGRDRTQGYYSMISLAAANNPAGTGAPRAHAVFILMTRLKRVQARSVEDLHIAGDALSSRLHHTNTQPPLNEQAGTRVSEQLLATRVIGSLLDK
jgi:hypothetical protein